MGGRDGKPQTRLKNVSRMKTLRNQQKDFAVVGKTISGTQGV